MQNIQKLVLLILSCLLVSCSSGDAPTKSWELAAKGVYGADLSDDGELIVIGSIMHGGSLWRVADHERLYDWNHRKGELTNIDAAAISPDGNFAFTANPQTMVLWSTQDGKALTFWNAPTEVTSVALTPNGQFALLGLADFTAVLYDAKHGGIKRTFHHQNRVRSVALSRDGKIAVTGSEDQTVKLWEVLSGKLLQQWQHNDEVRLVAISGDGSRVFSVSKYDKAMLWDAQTGNAIGELPLRSYALQRGLTFTAAEFSPDGRLLLTGTADRLVQLWNVKSQRELARWILPKRDPWKPTSAAVVALSFATQDRQYYAMASNGYLHQLNVK